jgi:hypothetical protein
MNAAEIATLARVARKAGINTMLELAIAGELLQRGEATLVSLSNSLNLPLEPIAHAVATMQASGSSRAVVCRQVMGFTIARLSPHAEKQFREFINPVKLPVKKNLGLRLTRCKPTRTKSPSPTTTTPPSTP